MPEETKLLPILALMLATASAAHAQLDTRLPIISRVEVKYSIVTRRIHVPERILFYDQWGDPKGSGYYAVPYLVYEPEITLYNPYNTYLTLDKSRIQIANPPVGFRFRKNGDALRAEWTDGGPFLGLGRFQDNNQENQNVGKTLTLSLSSLTGIDRPGGLISLKPGESKTFMAWVENIWTWGVETGSANTPSRSFYDFDVTRDRTNKDPRTNNLFGAEAVVGRNYAAGFQTDLLSTPNGRPPATRYSFETGTYGTTSWVATKLTDTVRVDAKGVDTAADPAIPDFQLSLLAGKVQNPVTDTLRAYSFSIDDLIQPAAAGPDVPSITRTFLVLDIFQASSDKTPGGKTPFASFQLVAKSKALQNRKFQAEVQPPASELYEARLVEIADFTEPFPAGPSDHPTGGVVVTGVERVGDWLMLDLAAAPHRSTNSWKVMGGQDPSYMDEDLSHRSLTTEGAEGTGIYKMAVLVPAGKEKYFVQVGY